MASGLAGEGRCASSSAGMRHPTPDSARNSLAQLAGLHGNSGSGNGRNATPPVEKEGDAFR